MLRRAGAFAGADDNVDNFKARYLPFPLRFHMVWNQRHGKKPIYAWKPVPPSDEFVALGCVCTTTDEPPARESVRCVPRTWVTPTNDAAPVWDDSGTAGRRGSFWAVGNMGLLTVVQGHAAPSSGLYDIKTSKKDAKGSLYFMAHEPAYESGGLKSAQVG